MIWRTMLVVITSIGINMLKNKLWCNKETQDLYKVWMVAENINDLSLPKYVIYQKAELAITEVDIFPVQHSENDKKGYVCNIPFAPNDWMLKWEDVSSEPLALATPIELWNERFEKHEAIA